MHNDIEKNLILLFDTENIKPEDQLSKLIDNELNHEIFEDDLQYVSAAGKRDYEYFKKVLYDKRK